MHPQGTDTPLAADGHASTTSQTLLERGRRRLAARGAGARLEAELLLAHLLHCSRGQLLAHLEHEPGVAVASSYAALIERAAAGEPLAYLTGAREFWSLPLAVSPAVLVPRPETELVVERCLALLPPHAPRAVSAAQGVGDPAGAALSACDLGTGSGAIALALAAERPAWQLTATDRSPAALAVARANAARLGARNVEFLEGDWFAPLGSRRFALVAANPPYIGAHDPALAALRFEPLEALSPGASGFEALELIVSGACRHLAPGGWLVLEHGAEQGALVAQALEAAGYVRVRCHRDLAGHDRVTEAQRP